MKQAYLSVVIAADAAPQAHEVAAADAMLATLARAHEIVLVIPYSADAPDYSALEMSGPLSVVRTHTRATVDSASIAGLARAVGDFIVEWRTALPSLDAAAVSALLAPTNSSVEFVELVPTDATLASRLRVGSVNRLRARNAPVRESVARLYSRHALQEVLTASTFEPQLDVLAAELPVRRHVVHSSGLTQSRTWGGSRLTDGVSLLTKGTAFGSSVPLALAALFFLLAVAVAGYWLWRLVAGDAPGALPLLLAVACVAQGAVLAMLSLIWTRIDSLTRGLSRNYDATAEVLVFAPAAPTRAPRSDEATLGQSDC